MRWNAKGLGMLIRTCMMTVATNTIVHEKQGEIASEVLYHQIPTIARIS
jgi:hypothetical protein